LSMDVFRFGGEGFRMDATAFVPAPRVRSQILTFGRHFLEMCISMCMGGALLALIAFGAIPSLVGNPILRELYPQPSLLLIAVLLTVPMAAWMLYRGMPLRPTLEMAAVPVGLALLLIVTTSAGMLEADVLQIEFSAFCGLACVGMFVVMLFRLDLYTGHGGAHPHHAAPAS
jgi:hypothetical protein